MTSDNDLDLWMDYETKSCCNIKVQGVYNYAQHPTTKVLMLSYAFGDEDIQTWVPGTPFPERIRAYFERKPPFKGFIKATNATFERLISWYVLCPDYDLPEPPLEAFYCIAAESRSNCGPGKLEDIGRFAGTGMRKDYRGNYLIKQLCVPQADGTFKEDANLFQEMVQYCEQDVRVMRAASKTFRPLSPAEIYDYHVNERINDRGVTVDRNLAVWAQQYANDEVSDMRDRIAEITEGAITSPRSRTMTNWVVSRLGERAAKLTRKHKTDKKTKETKVSISMDASTRTNLLVMHEETPDESNIPAVVAEVIRCVDDSWASSTAKFKKMFDLCDEGDGRLRGCFVFAGGFATGRYSSYGAQVHNLPRRVAEDPEAVRAAMKAKEYLDSARREKYGLPVFGKNMRVFDVLKKMLRPALMASAGSMLTIADWSSIEARVTPWSSNSASGDEKLEAFRKGLDPYIVNAAGSFGVNYDDIALPIKAGKILANTEMTAEERDAKISAIEEGYGKKITREMIDSADRMRQIGKIQELACGFMGGVGAFHVFSLTTSLRFTDDEAQSMVNAWRKANAWSVPYWDALKRAYTGAMRNPHVEFSAGRVTYMFDGTHLWYILPDKSILRYPYARLVKGKFGPEVEYAKASYKPSAEDTEWPRARLWPGLAAENITQAIANRLLRQALADLEDELDFAYEEGRLSAPAYVVLHCHDEIAVEHKEADASIVQQIITDIMTTPPAWCTDLPLAIGAPATSRRYGK